MPSENPHPVHPEVAEDPEAFMPVEQVTLRHIMVELTNKVSSATGAAQKFATLHDPGTGRIVANAYRMDPGTLEEDPEKVGSIVFREAGKGNSDVITDYRLYEIPDGFHIAKYTHMVPSPFIPTRQMAERLKQAGRLDLSNAPAPPSLEGQLEQSRINELAVQSLKSVFARNESRATQDALGLSFVSETEARDLLARVTPLRPETA